MKLNRKQNDASHIVNLNSKRSIDANLAEERPSAFTDTLDADMESTEVADMLIRQNQISADITSTIVHASQERQFNVQNRRRWLEGSA